MDNRIYFTFEGTEYTLEYTRKSIETMERQGFVAEDIVSKPMTTLPALFAGAFLAHHKHIKKETVDKIFEKLKDKQKLIGALAEMYNQPIIALIDDDESDDEKNVSWERR